MQNMIHLFRLTCLIHISSCMLLSAQVAINNSNTDPDASAMLDISSTDKGILVPRMDSTGRKAIASPADGLMVYDSTTLTYWYYDDSQWNEIRNGSTKLSATDLFDNLPSTDSCASRIVGSVQNIDSEALVVSGNYAYATDINPGTLKIIDIRDPTAPIEKGTLSIGGAPGSVAILDNFAYVVVGGNLQVVDVSDPATPALRGSLPIGSGSFVVANNNFVYAIDDASEELKIIDVSDPNNPAVIGSLFINGGPSSMAVSGIFAYVLNKQSDDLKIIDVSSLNVPTLRGSLPIGNDPSAVAVSGSFAYVVDLGSSDLKIIDISDPDIPALRGSLPIGSGPISVAVSRSFAYVVDQFSLDLKIIDVSDPTAPIVVESLLTENFPTSVAVSGSFVYVGGSSNGLKVIPIAPCDFSIALDPLNGNFKVGVELWSEIDSNAYRILGNIGIGTVSPKNKLDVAGGMAIGSTYSGREMAPTNGAIIEGNVSIGTSSSLNKLDVAGGIAIGSAYVGTESAPTNGAIFEGNVGIGTSGTQNKLDVAGAMAIGGTYASAETAPANGAIIEGNVGIGVVTPQNKLDVEGGMAIGSTYSGTNAAPANGAIIEGNVSIGTSSSLNKLDVSGAMAIGGTYASAETAPANGAIIEGNVGIGVVTPQNKLDVEGGMAIGSTYSGTNAAPANGAIIEGKVGIGTNDPKSQLDVNGDIRISNAALPMGIFTELLNSGNTPLLNFAVNARNPDLLADSIGGFFRIDSRSEMNSPLFQWWRKPRNAAAPSGNDLLMALNENGHLGIGNLNPTVALDVVGDIQYTGTIVDVSDRRLKENLLPVSAVSSQLLQLQAYSYNMIGNEDKRREYGLIAQEVQEVFPELVSVVDQEEGHLGVSYIQLVPLLLEAVKELKAENKDLASQIQELKAMITK